MLASCRLVQPWVTNKMFSSFVTFCCAQCVAEECLVRWKTLHDCYAKEKKRSNFQVVLLHRKKERRLFLLLEFLDDHLLQPRYESLFKKFFS